MSKTKVLFNISAQAGQNDMATELLQKAIKIEQEELGERPERMLELLYLEAYILDEVRIFKFKWFYSAYLKKKIL